MDERLAGFQLILIQNGVEHHKYLGFEEVRVLDQFGDVLHGVGGVGAGAKLRRTDVNRICPGIDGSHALLQVFGGRQDFDLLFHATKIGEKGEME